MRKPRWLFSLFAEAAERETFEHRFGRAAALISPGFDSLTAERDGVRLAELRAVLEDLHRGIPKFAAWCVVKHYQHHTHGDGWAPRIWIACTTKAQAEAMAPAIAEHYVDKDHRSGWTRSEAEGRADRFVVERRTDARIGDLVSPELTPGEYVADLG